MMIVGGRANPTAHGWCAVPLIRGQIGRVKVSRGCFPRAPALVALERRAFKSLRLRPFK